MIETLTLDTRKCDSPVGKARISPLRRGERNNVTLGIAVRRDRKPYDLTGMTASLLWQAADGKLVGPVPMEVTDPAAGTVRPTPAMTRRARRSSGTTSSRFGGEGTFFVPWACFCCDHL